MRVIGGHDYYDSALAYGRDDDILFVRNNLEFKATDTPLEWPRESVFALKYNNMHQVGNSLRTNRCIIAYVCGVRYFGVDIYDNVDFKEVIWSYDKLTQYADKHRLKIYSNKFWWRDSISVEDSFNVKTTKEQLEWLISNRVAIAVGCWNVNAPQSDKIWYCNNAKDYALRKFQFQKLMDPYTLFQELSMFVGNLPKDGPPMVTITDPDIKIAKHGFDKWSFRKHKNDPK